MDESHNIIIDPIPVLPHLPSAEDDVGGVVHQFQHHDEGPSDAALLLAANAAIIPSLPQGHDNTGICIASTPLKRDAENDAATLNHEEAKRQKTTSSTAPLVTNPNHAARPTKKERQEFTAAEKVRILELLDGTRRYNHQQQQQQPTMTFKQIREKFGVSKSSLHRWRQQKPRLQIMVQSERLGGRKRDTKDPLEKIKIGLQTFYNDNLVKSPEERLIITTPVVQAMANKIRDELLAEYDAAVADAAAAAAVGNDGQQEQQQLQQPQLSLNEEELTALRAFKVTKSWAGRVASSMGWLSQPRKKIIQQEQQQQQLHEQKMDPGGGIVHDTSVAVASDGTTAVTTEEKNDEEKAKLNTLAFLSRANPDYSSTNPKDKKARKEFTAMEKIAIIAEMDPQQTPTPLNMAEICEKYSTSKSSVFRWKQQHRAGTFDQMINEEGRGNFKRDVNDKLGRVKRSLRDFIENNHAQPPETRVQLTVGVLHGKAQEFREELMAQYDLDPTKSDLNEDEVDSLRKFKASKGWVRKVAASFGWKDVEDLGNNYGDGGGAMTAASVADAEGTLDALLVHPQQEHPHDAVAPPPPAAAPQHSINDVEMVMVDLVLDTAGNAAGSVDI